MKLRITTPLSVVVETEVASVRADDASGSFGILPGHADLITALDVSVVSWTTPEGQGARPCCAVRGGILTMTGGALISIATREAVLGDDLATLDRSVLDRFRAEAESERVEHVEATRLQLQALRRMMGRLSAGHGRESFR
jgi:F-type H+-transporting ATPase subunit epsilon